MKIITHVFKSSLGKKYIMAVTGFFLFLFVLGHLAGNLQVFVGPEAINRYGYFLQSNVELLWPVRVILMIFLVLHIWSASALSVENKRARPVGYAEWKPIGSTVASRTMLMSGVIVFIFVVYHILHYTAEVKYINLTGQSFVDFVDPKKRHDIFKMMVVGFSNGWVSAFYILGIGLLCLHLSHGASSMFQSLGWKNEGYRSFLDQLARVVAVIVFAGYISIPVAILLGYGQSAIKTEAVSPKTELGSPHAVLSPQLEIHSPPPVVHQPNPRGLTSRSTAADLGLRTSAFDLGISQRTPNV